ncbi:Putative ATP/GTP-binding protein [Frankia alni ACN14a]|uniref:ATP/GTP-binding protein n=1 Tax=Frankia alni (strain DSM 45986 / CECT 9034 / ACN14a) TaxID=326424 RepID=Q0RRL0_FRAAA|nr:Putative ATP/GTP-binding protein [Frankia alni ACN14a]
MAGGFGAGKTTFVGSVSEIVPLRTEAVMTEAGAHVDDLTHLSDKTTTTVAMDFGRVSLDEDLILYLFGTPGQYRFWFMWDDIVRGAIGAIVLADTRRLADCFAAVDYFEQASAAVRHRRQLLRRHPAALHRGCPRGTADQPDRADHHLRRPQPGLDQERADRRGRAHDVAGGRSRLTRCNPAPLHTCTPALPRT